MKRYQRRIAATVVALSMALLVFYFYSHKRASDASKELVASDPVSTETAGWQGRGSKADALAVLRDNATTLDSTRRIDDLMSEYLVQEDSDFAALAELQDLPFGTLRSYAIGMVLK